MQTFIRKITSRKFIVAVVGIIVGIAAAFGIEENDYAQMVGLVGSIATAIGYIVGESKVDQAGALNSGVSIQEAEEIAMSAAAASVHAALGGFEDAEEISETDEE